MIIFSTMSSVLFGQNVGVGTLAPTDKLEIKTATSNYGMVHTDGVISVGSFVGGTGTGKGGWYGTKSNHPLFFFSYNNPPQLSLLQNGNFGVGTLTPEDKFQVNTATSRYGMVQTDGVVSVGSYVGGVGTGKGGWYGTKSNHPLFFFAYNNPPQVALLPNGNMGVGTVTPTNKFQVNTSTSNYGVIHTDGTIAVGTFVGGTSKGGFIGTKSNHPLYLFTNDGGPQLTVLQNGNVGIGTINPTYQLSVNGNIRSKELVVETGWADYVFDEDYKRLSLADVEKFIKVNNHLPNVPSAQNIQTNGLKVGEMQTKMMEKIEELTLYVIELKKEIDLLKAK